MKVGWQELPHGQCPALWGAGANSGRWRVFCLPSSLWSGPVAKFRDRWWWNYPGVVTTAGHGHIAHYRHSLAARVGRKWAYGQHSPMSMTPDEHYQMQSDDINNDVPTIIRSGLKCAKYNKWTEDDATSGCFHLWMMLPCQPWVTCVIQHENWNV